MQGRLPRSNIVSLTAEALDKFLVWFSILIGAALTINMITAVFFRYVLNSPIFWADELSLFLFCWITFLGGSLAVRRSDMAAVTVILNSLPFTARKLVSMLVQCSILFFAVVIGYYSIIWIKSPSVMNMLSPALSVKVWVLYTIVPFSMLCIAVFAVEHLLRLLQELMSGKGGE